MFSNGGCDQLCTNSNGSFECSCENGFLLDVNGFICNGENIWYKYMKYLSMKYNILDINECSEGLDMCSYNASCTNTEGGYNCSCEYGYHGNGFICNSNIIIILTTVILGRYDMHFSDTDECAEGSDSCDSNAECMDIDGSYYCLCNTGFTGNGSSCTGR